MLGFIISLCIFLNGFSIGALVLFIYFNRKYHLKEQELSDSFEERLRRLCVNCYYKKCVENESEGFPPT